jgi:hypothetical protein
MRARTRPGTRTPDIEPVQPQVICSRTRAAAMCQPARDLHVEREAAPGHAIVTSCQVDIRHDPDAL